MIKSILLCTVLYNYYYRGDVIGVVLPTENSIPMIGSESDSTLLVRFGNEEVSSDLNGLLAISRTLHLYVKIGKLLVDSMPHT